jgi:hypothetical protein
MCLAGKLIGHMHAPYNRREKTNSQETIFEQETRSHGNQAIPRKWMCLHFLLASSRVTHCQRLWKLTTREFGRCGTKPGTPIGQRQHNFQCSMQERRAGSSNWSVLKVNPLHRSPRPHVPSPANATSATGHISANMWGIFYRLGNATQNRNKQSKNHYVILQTNFEQAMPVSRRAKRTATSTAMPAQDCCGISNPCRCLESR